MDTRIDVYLTEYLLATMDNESITVGMVQKLLDSVRKAFDYRSVYILENLADKYEYVYSYTSVRDDVGDFCDREVFVRPKDYNRMFESFDENHIRITDDGTESALEYAYSEGNMVKGIVGFRHGTGYEWTAEEREAVTKLARSMHPFVIISEAKKFITQNMFKGKEREQQYQKELELTNNKLERAINSNDGMFRQILKMQSCGIIVYKLPEWELYMVNDMAKVIYECDDEDGFEQFDMPNVTYDNYDVTMDLINAMSKPGDIVAYEFEVKHRDGAVVSVDAVSNIIETETGEKFFISSLRDVTVQKQLEYDLEIEKLQYRDAILSDVLFAYTFDVTKGIVEGDFSGVRNGVGWENIGMKPPFEYDSFILSWEKEKKPHFLNGGTIKQIMRGSLLKAYESGKNNLVFDYEIPSEDYSLRNTILLSNNPKNNHVIACVTLKDVTETLWMEERRQNELRRANESLKRQMYIINSLGDIYLAVIYIDVQKNHYSRINARGYVAEALDHEGIVSESSPEVIELCVDDEYKDIVKDFMNLDTLHDRMLETKMIYCEFVGSHYGWIRASFIKARVDEAGRLKQVLFTIQLIDDEKRKEIEAKKALSAAVREADYANKAKSDFLSKMSHDIRTPLNAIIGMTAIASSNAKDSEKVVDCMKKITSSGKYLLSLINEVLDMSKIESGKIILSEDKFNIISLIDNIVEMTRPLVSAKKHEFTLDVEDIEHKFVVGDSLRIQQVFTNLLSNAVKYTPERGHIRLTVREEDNDGKGMEGCGCYVFVFEDDGIGMSDEFQKKIFVPFEREQDSRTDKIQGTGLGMTIAYNLVRMMNGDIEVVSKLNEGSRFIVRMYLRLQEGEDGNYGDVIGPSNSDRPLDIMNSIDLTGKRVLLVEDNDINREIAVEIISETGVAVETAVDGQEAVDKVSDNPSGYYDLIFMDIQMPVKNGYEATREIRALPRGDLREIPIVAMTANAFAEDVLEAGNAGMNEHVSKPFDLKRLLEVMGKWIK